MWYAWSSKQMLSKPTKFDAVTTDGLTVTLTRSVFDNMQGLQTCKV